jgi:predicted secreted protein
MLAGRQPIVNERRSPFQEEDEDAQPVPDRDACPALHGAGPSNRSGPPGIEPDCRAVDDTGACSSGPTGHAADRRSDDAAGADRARRPRRDSGRGRWSAQRDAIHRGAHWTDPRPRPRHRWGRALWHGDASLAFKIALAAVLLPLAAIPAEADTVLRLAETATVSVAPDELVATLRVETSAPTAAEAQRKVNASVADALARIRQQPGIIASTGVYNVWQAGPSPQDRGERWHANQTVALHAHEGSALLNLVGELQQKQLAVQQLAWQLAAETARRAQRDATMEGLKTLRSRAEEAAALIGLQFDSFREVRLDNARPPLMPRGLAAASMAATTLPPSAEAEDVVVSATVEADVVLKPR